LRSKAAVLASIIGEQPGRQVEQVMSTAGCMLAEPSGLHESSASGCQGAPPAQSTRCPSAARGCGKHTDRCGRACTGPAIHEKQSISGRAMLGGKSRMSLLAASTPMREEQRRSRHPEVSRDTRAGAGEPTLRELTRMQRVMGQLFSSLRTCTRDAPRPCQP
jgi:hypothetical protein